MLKVSNDGHSDPITLDAMKMNFSARVILPGGKQRLQFEHRRQSIKQGSFVTLPANALTPRSIGQLRRPPKLPKTYGVVAF